MDVVVNQDATDLADYDKKKMMRPKFMRIVMMMTLMWIGTMTMQILKILMNGGGVRSLLPLTQDVC